MRNGGYSSNGATISDCGTYRYKLWRNWDYEKAGLVWVMLNPSTADASQSPRVIRTTSRRRQGANDNLRS